MACKYVDNFEFPSEAGFTGSAGKTMVSGYARGGTVKQAVAAFKKADAKQDAKLVAKAVESVKPMKKGLGGIVKALSPLAAIASGDAPKGIGALGGVAGLLLENELRKKRNRQPVVAPSVPMPLGASTTGVVAPTGMRKGGKVGVPVHNRAPMFGKKY